MECDLLVHRWAILRKPIPQKHTLGKITALTYSLCKLHNYCIDEREEACYQQTRGDAFCVVINGSIAMDSDNKGNVLDTGITNGGKHSDDVDCRRVIHNNLPRDKMLAMCS